MGYYIYICNDKIGDYVVSYEFPSIQAAEKYLKERGYFKDKIPLEYKRTTKIGINWATICKAATRTRPRL